MCHLSQFDIPAAVTMVGQDVDIKACAAGEKGEAGNSAAHQSAGAGDIIVGPFIAWQISATHHRSEEHTSELQSLMRISYAVFCLKKKNKTHTSDRCNRQIINRTTKIN